MGLEESCLRAFVTLGLAVCSVLRLIDFTTWLWLWFYLVDFVDYVWVDCLYVVDVLVSCLCWPVEITFVASLVLITRFAMTIAVMFICILTWGSAWVLVLLLLLPLRWLGYGNCCPLLGCMVLNLGTILLN